MIARGCGVSHRHFTALLRHNHIPSTKPAMTHFCELGQMVQIYKRAGSADRTFPTKPILPMKTGLLALAGVYAYNPLYLSLLTANPGYSSLFILFLFMFRKPCQVSYEVQNMYLLDNGVQAMIELRSGHWKLIEIQDISKIVKRELEVELHFQHEKPLIIRDRKEYKLEEQIFNMILKGHIVDLKRAGLGYHRLLFRRQACPHSLSLLKEMKFKRIQTYDIRWNWRNTDQFHRLLRQRKLRCRFTYYDFRDFVKKKKGTKKYKTPKEVEQERRDAADRDNHNKLVKELRENYSIPIYSQTAFYSNFKITPQDLKDILDKMSESEIEEKMKELLEFPTQGRKFKRVM